VGLQVDARLLAAIGAAGIQKQAAEMMRRALVALDNLGALDESLFERFVATNDPARAAALSAASLRSLWEDTFRGLLDLLAFLEDLGSGEGDTEVSTTMPLEFDFGEGEGADPAPVSGAVLGLADIGGLLENIDEHAQTGEADRWADVLEKAGSIRYGLQSQYVDSLERMEVALKAGQLRQVLALMDDAQGSASEGVHALVSGVYEAFLPDVDPATILPGYLTLLGRALLVRRALSELAAKLGPQNDTLQGNDAARAKEALGELRSALDAFLSSAACRAMRPADRWQLVEFERSLREARLAAARQTSEGLVKYLESLGAINQREVLLRFDERALAELREALASARGLLELSPSATAELLQRAYLAARRLRGRHLRTDRLLTDLELEESRLRREARWAPLLELLEAFLVAAGG
jgi:hypothetical protein